MIESVLNTLTSNLNISTCCQVGGSEIVSQVLADNFDFVRVYTKQNQISTIFPNMEVKETEEPLNTVGLVENTYDFAYISIDFGYDVAMDAFKILARNDTSFILCGPGTHTPTSNRYSQFKFTDNGSCVLYYQNIVSKELEKLNDDRL